MTQHERGTSFVEIIVGIAIMTIVFLAFFSSFQAAFTFAERNRLRSNALLLANEHVEVLRALPYDSVGTVAGLPSGSIPQTEDIVYQGKTYTRRTFIQYVDDPADGTDAGDTLTADYKRIKVEMTYTYQDVTQSFSVVTTVAPPSQESLVGAGVLRINVTDALNAPLLLAQVHIVNTTIATSVDITTFTNSAGTISFPGAWAGSGYEVYVTKSGYSSAQTYTVTPGNPNPSPSPLNVAENATTEVYFKVDRLSSIDLYARLRPVRDRFLDSFTDTSGLASQYETQVTGGALTLSGAPGTYSAMGTSSSVTVAPGAFGGWLLFSFDDTVPADTSASYTIEYDDAGIFLPIPDADLPGNAAGFTQSPVDLSGLDTGTYASLRVVSTLTSTDVAETPYVNEYKLSYLESDVPVGGLSFSLVGSKTIGSDAGGNPIYKYNQTPVTDGDGEWDSGDMEWDAYTLTVPGYAVAEACPSLPLVLEPNVALGQTLTLAPVSPHALQVYVVGTLDNALSPAEVRVTGGTTDETWATGPCGAVYVSGLAETTYTVAVQAPGHVATTTTVAVSGNTTHTVQLSAL